MNLFEKYFRLFGIRFYVKISKSIQLEQSEGRGAAYGGGVTPSHKFGIGKRWEIW